VLSSLSGRLLLIFEPPPLVFSSRNPPSLLMMEGGILSLSLEVHKLFLLGRKIDFLPLHHEMGLFLERLNPSLLNRPAPGALYWFFPHCFVLNEISFPPPCDTIFFFFLDWVEADSTFLHFRIEPGQDSPLLIVRADPIRSCQHEMSFPLF